MTGSFPVAFHACCSASIWSDIITRSPFLVTAFWDRTPSNIEQTLESLRREFLLELSTGFVYDQLRDRAGQLDLAEHRRMVLKHFSGTLCVDELHLSR
jgi:hypothetical protein